MENKTTNVAPDELNYDHYETEKYDADIVKTIPGHRELHAEITKILKEYPKEAPEILELGIGTGLTTEKIFTLLSDAKVTAIDFSEKMLDGAKKRLADKNVTFITGDYAEISFDTNFDVVISVIGIHHQTNEGKKKLFKKIYNCLDKGGLFIFGDLVTYNDKEKAIVCEQKHYKYLVDNANDETSLKEWTHHHKELNILAPLEDQIDWLKEAGFSSIEVKFEQYNTVLLLAKK